MILNKCWNYRGNSFKNRRFNGGKSGKERVNSESWGILVTLKSVGWGTEPPRVTRVLRRFRLWTPTSYFIFFLIKSRRYSKIQFFFLLEILEVFITTLFSESGVYFFFFEQGKRSMYQYYVYILPRFCFWFRRYIWSLNTSITLV